MSYERAEAKFLIPDESDDFECERCQNIYPDEELCEVRDGSYHKYLCSHCANKELREEEEE
jgi:Zn finger protein HypA/HybF involved in hydrogenase expression